MASFDINSQNEKNRDARIVDVKHQMTYPPSKHFLIHKTPRIQLVIVLTPHKLYSSSHPPDSARDQIRDAASHQCREGHQKQKPATRPRHHGADPPFQTRDALEGGVTSTLLQHHRPATGFIPYWIRTTPERSEGYRLAHLWPEEPVRHEEAHAWSSRTQEGQQGPNHTCAGKTGRHLGDARSHHSANFHTDANESKLSVTTAYRTTNPDPPSVVQQGYTWGAKSVGTSGKVQDICLRT